MARIRALVPRLVTSGEGDRVTTFELLFDLVFVFAFTQVTEFMAGKVHPGKDRTSGHFGFAGHNDPVMFRNISIERLN